MADGTTFTAEDAAKAASADFVTVLTSVDTVDEMGIATPAPRRLTKSIYRKDDGTIGVKDYDFATWYSMREVPIGGLADLKTVIDGLTPYEHLVNGTIIPGTDTSRAPWVCHPSRSAWRLIPFFQRALPAFVGPSGRAKPDER